MAGRPAVGRISFVRDPEFDPWKARGPGLRLVPLEAEYGPVEWRFAPSAAAVARSFLFHPDQQMVDEDDGSLTVRFTASGWLEMAWHLYTWGDKVEVIAPPAVRSLVDAYRRSDFAALP